MSKEHKQSTLDFVKSYFNVEEDEFVHHHGGICYSTITVKTREAAEKVNAKVKGGTVNGGYLHGMPLGGISENKEKGTFSVTC